VPSIPTSTPGSDAATHGESDGIAGPTVVVVPTLNEALNIPELVRRVSAAAPDAHLMIMDDQSSDGTAEVAMRAFAGRPGYRIITRTGPRGLGRAYVEGFQTALAEGYATIIQMDADLSHDPAAIPSLRNALRDCDLAIGSRYCHGGGVEGWAAHRLWLSRFANVYARTITGMGIGDITAGYRAWRATALQHLHLETVQSSGYSIQVELAVRAYCAGLRVREVPIIFTDRKRGISKMNAHVLMESVRMPWRLRAYVRTVQREGRWQQSL